MKKKRFTAEDYEQIKQVLSDNKIDTKRLAQYGVYKKLRWYRHAERIDCTDEEIEMYVNGEIDMDSIKKGPNWKED